MGELHQNNNLPIELGSFILYNVLLSAEYSSVFGDVDVEDRTLNVGVDFYCITQPQPRAASRARNEGFTMRKLGDFSFANCLTLD